MDHTRDFLMRAIIAMEAKRGVHWVVERQDREGEPIGMIGLEFTAHGAALGCVLEHPSWGRGYATEAAQAVVDWALGEARAPRVWAVCDAEHRAFARVLEKVGMRREGLLQRWVVLPNRSAEPRDCWCYARVVRSREARRLVPSGGQRVSRVASWMAVAMSMGLPRVRMSRFGVFRTGDDGEIRPASRSRIGA